MVPVIADCSGALSSTCENLTNQAHQVLHIEVLQAYDLAQWAWTPLPLLVLLLLLLLLPLLLLLLLWLLPALSPMPLPALSLGEMAPPPPPPEPSALPSLELCERSGNCGSKRCTQHASGGAQRTFDDPWPKL